ncbi:hypothetical protein DAPPUDRAFT_265716 [Daphnia pulex]|uniref:Uncharacterized protein n=1 Tax=Daphnia pulex TaxID=6669 RepID=E9HTX1_DAPPU|nr:hypothetical protein DAPPUDRAFT_265716 [Daphnia pulex]|eukprot:EFX64813.1 hypothetical protein DAPPUDRAFT_265716 [Daphnia pulex]
MSISRSHFILQKAAPFIKNVIANLFPPLYAQPHTMSHPANFPSFPIQIKSTLYIVKQQAEAPNMLNHPRRGLPRITDGIERHPDAYLLDTAANLHHLIAEKQHLISTSVSSPKSNFKIRQSRMEKIHHTTRENSHTLYYLPIQPLEASRTRLSKGGDV